MKVDFSAHVLVDLQACQSLVHGSRGIGRYATSLVEGILRLARGRRLSFLLNGDMPESAAELRSGLLADMDPSAIHTWHAPAPRRAIDEANRWRGDAARVIRDAVIESIAPDCVLLTSFFEGWVDDCVSALPSSEARVATAVVVYDLIPFLYQDIYLRDAGLKAWYLRKIERLAKVDVVLAISESARREVMEVTGLDSSRVINISSAVDPRFLPQALSAAEEQSVRQRLGLDKPFVMYTGGIDHRKNIDLLIEAFADTGTYAKTHQLAIVCKVESGEAARLMELGRSAGLQKGALVLTGYVSDDDLLTLYAMTELFVFPSWHEGFGLPVLEAMSVGAPVAVAMSSSLPEVVGPNGQFFDPYKKKSITDALLRLLSDASLREHVARNGLERSREFSWDRTASAGWTGLMHAVAMRKRNEPVLAEPRWTRPKLAYLSPLPPQRSGIADFSAELLPELTAHYDIELIIDDGAPVPELDGLALPIRTTSWFLQNADRFDRVLYHFGNSEFHSHMFDVLERVPGVVVLHDFFLGNLHHFLQDTGQRPGIWQQALYEGHGYGALDVLKTNIDRNVTAFAFPCNWRVLSRSDGIIVHSSHSKELAAQWFGPEIAESVIQMPLLRKAHPPADRAAARRALGVRDDKLIVATYGMLSAAKCNDSLVEAWIAGFADRDDCHLVFVGHAADPAWEHSLRQRLDKLGVSNFSITGFVDATIYRKWLAATDVAVQLRRQSRGETSAAVLDCFAWSIPTIVNAHGSMAELPPESAIIIDDLFTIESLVAAMNMLLMSDKVRKLLGRAGRDYLIQQHDPALVASMYRDTIETLDAKSSRRMLQRAVSRLTATGNAFVPIDADLDGLSIGLSPLFGPAMPRPQLLVDVSELVQSDARSGIQRVVRSVLRELLANGVPGWRVEPVYTTGGGAYAYARSFTCRFMDIPETGLPDDVIEAGANDVFLGLDLVPTGIPAATKALSSLRANGVKLAFVVYDLLPVVHPEWFPPNAPAVLAPWYEAVARLADRVICISRSVADEFAAYVEDRRRSIPLELSWFHLGADVEASRPSSGITDIEAEIIQRLENQSNIVLMVGTIEPRKGHDQALEAFARLRERHTDVRLVIVGKQGWCVEDVVDRLRQDVQVSDDVVWFPSASDQVLERLYKLAKLVLVASRGEGFGLPIVEAAMRGVTVLARDLPVFREVGGTGIIYFSGDDGDSLAQEIEMALGMVNTSGAPDLSGVSILPWSLSTSRLIEAATGKFVYRVLGSTSGKL